MKKQTILLSAGLIMLSTSVQAAGMMPTNPMGTVFAPWNTMPGMPGGFSPLNNGFTSGGPMGVSPFSMSPFGSNGSPWGSMPSNMMPWNAWSSSPGSVVPWGNQMPWGQVTNFSNNGNGMVMPWGGNNNGNMMQMPWGNNRVPWNGTRNNYSNNRKQNNGRDALGTMLLMQELSGQQGLPGLSGAPMMAPPPMPANIAPVPLVPQQQNGFVVPQVPRVFNPFNTQQHAPAQMLSPANASRNAPAFGDPFSAQAEKEEESKTAKPTNPAPAFDPFATGTEGKNLQFPDADSFFLNKN